MPDRAPLPAPADLPQGTLYWADSELRALRPDGADLCLHFAAAQFRPGPPAPRTDGGSPGNGWLRGLVLRLHRARWPAGLALADACGRIGHGRLDLPGAAAGAGSRLRLPVALHVPLRLSLALPFGVQFDIDAEGLSSAADGPVGWQESLAC